MNNYNLLYFDRSWLLIAVWQLALNRITHFIQGVLSGIVDKARHFAKTGEFIVLAKGLVQLASTSTASGSGGSLAWSHIVDPGTDCLVVSVGAQGTNNTVASGTFGGQSLTILGTAIEATNARRSAILYLKNPIVSTGTITIVFTNTPSTRGHAMNWQGTQDVPFRAVSTTSLYGESVSLSPISSIGDVVIDSMASNLTTWVPAAGQTGILTGTLLGVSKKNGESGTTTMTWTGSAAYVALVTAALKGS